MRSLTTNQKQVFWVILEQLIRAIALHRPIEEQGLTLDEEGSQGQVKIKPAELT